MEEDIGNSSSDEDLYAGLKNPYLQVDPLSEELDLTDANQQLRYFRQKTKLLLNNLKVNMVV
jgi:hypothetical protein